MSVLHSILSLFCWCSRVPQLLADHLVFNLSEIAHYLSGHFRHSTGGFNSAILPNLSYSNSAFHKQWAGAEPLPWKRRQSHECLALAENRRTEGSVSDHFASWICSRRWSSSAAFGLTLLNSPRSRSSSPVEFHFLSLIHFAGKTSRVDCCAGHPAVADCNRYL